jgi:hypothetical protein
MKIKNLFQESIFQPAVNMWIQASEEGNKGNHSKRIQLISDAKKKITEIVKDKLKDIKTAKEKFNVIENLKKSDNNPLVRSHLSNVQDSLRHSIKMESINIHSDE